MHCLSIDVGTRNLALAQLRVTPTAFHVLNADVLDVATLGGRGDIDCSKATVEELVELFLAVLPPRLDAWLRVGGAAAVDVMFVEQQPLGAGTAAHNVRTKCLGHVLQTLAGLRGIRTEFVSPRLKLRGMERGDGNRYRENKAYAVETVEAALAAEAAARPHDADAARWADWFAGLRRKRDDVADAIWQGVLACRVRLEAAAKAATKAARAAERAAQAPAVPKPPKEAPKPHGETAAEAAPPLVRKRKRKPSAYDRTSATLAAADKE